MIAEARADNKDNDVEYMKPSAGRCEYLSPCSNGLETDVAIE